MNARSLLFVPASRSERIPKALSSGADAVIVDLEDAVEASAKQSAREALRDFLRQHPADELLVRVNAPDSEYWEQDLELCMRAPNVSGIVVPKAESASDLDTASRTGKAIIPLLETARGFSVLSEMATIKGVVRLGFGIIDLSLDLNVELDTLGGETLLNHCRCQLVMASQVNQLATPLESVVTDINDGERVEKTAHRARQMGFGGMLCIPPRQIESVHAGFRPAEADIHWAIALLQAKTSTDDGAFVFNGKMVDEPVFARARRLLAQAGNSVPNKKSSS